MQLRLLRLVAAAILMSATPASAQLVELARAQTDFTFDFAYDSVHDSYVGVTGWTSVKAAFFDRAGRTVGSVVVDTRASQIFFPSILCLPDASDGLGGLGACIVIWSVEAGTADSRTWTLHAQLVSYPGRLVGPRTTLFTRTLANRGVGIGQIDKAHIAYSPSDRVFLVALVAGESSDILTPSFQFVTILVTANLTAQPLRELLLSRGPDVCVIEDSLSCNQVRVTWNPVAGEFGVMHSIGGQRLLARVRADGAIVGSTPLGIGVYYGALAVNSAAGTFLAIGTTAGRIDGAEIDQAGTLLARGLVTSSLLAEFRSGHFTDLAYSPVSGTFLLTGRNQATSGNNTLLVELNQHGVEMSSIAVPLGLAALAAHSFASEWIAASGSGVAIIGSATPFGGSTAQLSGCITPDPFSSLGGGRCVNRGWLPPGHPLIPPGTPPPPPPPSPPGNCTIPDPFTSLGGGVCVNGGWVPRGHPLAAGGS